MTGIIVTSNHKTFQLPALLSWNIVCTGGVPCDCFSVTCQYTPDMSGPLHLAAGFTARDDGKIFLRGIVDEYEMQMDGTGRTVTITGRGFAARLLDNESRPLIYQRATMAEILREHVTPYGISCLKAAPVMASSIYTVEAGASQWKALKDFCRVYGGFLPRFTREGKLIAAPMGTFVRRRVTDEAKVLSLTRRENHYGVLSEVLVIDKTRNVSYSVKNKEFLNRGGQCRRVVYTPGQSTWNAMRYTGKYQIAQSEEDELAMEIVFPEKLTADPGDLAELNLPGCGLQGEYRIAAVKNTLDSDGETTMLTLRKRE